MAYRVWVRTGSFVRPESVYVDPTQGKQIGRRPVEVELTRNVIQWLARGELQLVPPPGPEWPEGLREDVRDILEGAGLQPDEIASLDDETLLALRGIGKRTLEHIRQVFGG